MNLISVILIVIIFFTLWLGQSLWVYLDARGRKDSYAILWALLSLFSFPIPLIVYLIVSRSNKIRCRACGAIVEKGLTICTNCGNALGKNCKSCGNYMEESWNFCPHCNSKYDDTDRREN